jgi:hypothetical protein
VFDGHEKIVGGASTYVVGDSVLTQDATQLASWTKYDDPRRTVAAQPSVTQVDGVLRISGTGWPGIVKMFDATLGETYLVRTTTSMTRDGDLLYLGTWQQPQVHSLSGASSAGIPAPLIAQRWFPRERAFIADAPHVRMVVYSEAPSTDFVISSLDVLHLQPVPLPKAPEFAPR